MERPHGKGKEMFSNGDFYEGEFHKGYWEGKGMFFKKFKFKYTGDFKHGKMEGFGRKTYTNGNYYEGEFKDDL